MIPQGEQNSRVFKGCLDVFIHVCIGVRRGKMKGKKEKQEEPTITIRECYSIH